MAGIHVYQWQKRHGQVLAYHYDRLRKKHQGRPKLLGPKYSWTNKYQTQ